MGRRHKIYEDRTNGVFCHKYLTVPQVKTSDALLRASDKICEALTQANPNSDETAKAVDLLVKIFKRKAEEATSRIDQQRAQRAQAQAQRVESENEQHKSVKEKETQPQRVAEANTTQNTPSHSPEDKPPTLVPADNDTIDSVFSDASGPCQKGGDLLIDGMEINYSSSPNDIESIQITQDEDAPAYRTRSHKNMLLRVAEIAMGGLSMAQSVKIKFPLNFLVDYVNAVLDQETGELLEYRHLIKHPKHKKDWGYSFGNEIGRLEQGMPGQSKGTNTIIFIRKNEVPKDHWKDTAHARIICNVRQQKQEVNRTRLTYDGGNLVIPGVDLGTPTADLLTVKLLLNSVVYTKGARFACFDLKDFYLNTPLDRPEYLRMNISYFP